LDDARHGVGTVERALSAASEFYPRVFGQADRAEVHGAAGVVHRHAVDQHLVVTGIATADEQRGQATALAGSIHDRAGQEA